MYSSGAVTVRLELDESGQLLFFEASGHAGCGLKGHDIVCAAVTILLRTTVSALSGIPCRVDTNRRGFLSFRILESSPADTAKLQYAADFLWLGILSLKEEYPQAVQCEKIKVRGG